MNKQLKDLYYKYLSSGMYLLEFAEEAYKLGQKSMKSKEWSFKIDAIHNRVVAYTSGSLERHWYFDDDGMYTMEQAVALAQHHVDFMNGDLDE